MSEFKFTCPMCAQPIPNMIFCVHIPQCYHQFALENKFVPFCTCMKCKGFSSHPGDTFSNETKKRPIEKITPEVEDLTNEKSSRISSGETIDASAAVERFLGLKCVVCGESPKAKVPPILIGNYAIFQFCKKKHFFEDLSLLIKLIDQAAHKARSTKDAAPIERTFEHGSQEENEQSNAITFPCFGYITPDVRCKAKTDSFLTLDGKHFCKGSHIITYIINTYCKKGKKSSDATSN